VVTRGPGDKDVEATILESLDRSQPGQGAHPERLGDGIDLAPLTDGDHAEADPALLAVAHHLAIALFEDVQRQRHVRKEHHPKREERNLHGHPASVSS